MRCKEIKSIKMARQTWDKFNKCLMLVILSIKNCTLLIHMGDIVISDQLRESYLPGANELKSSRTDTHPVL